jgi:hypothetical protein
MHPVLKSCDGLLRALVALIDMVRSGVGIGGGFGRGSDSIWPAFVSRAVAQRYRAALRVVEAYLRRLLLVMALELEHTVVDTRQPLKRGRNRNRKWHAPSLRLVVFNAGRYDLTDQARAAFEAAADRKLDSRHRLRPAPPPKPVRMAPLYRRLDWLAKIAAHPLPTASRLAFNLARRRIGFVLPPDPKFRLPQRYGTETSMLFDSMYYSIMEQTRKRPPPQPPPQRFGPSVTIFKPPVPWFYPEWAR